MQQSGITKGEQAARVEFDSCYSVPSSAVESRNDLSGLYGYIEKYGVFVYLSLFWLFETEQTADVNVPPHNRASNSLKLDSAVRRKAIN
jgi:hypothetical protein